MSTTSPLPGWWQIMPPHRDIRQNRRLDESIFAADLGQVVAGTAPDDYQDPLRFFASTYLTDGLTALIGDVIKELAGTGVGNRIMQIETPFGGGKTHTLLALYHCIKHRAEVVKNAEVQWLLSQIGLPAMPDAGVATIVGTDLSAVEPVRTPDGTHIQTLWGLVAYQLGQHQGREREFYQIVQAADEQRSAPGADALRRLLAQAPALILMDELVNYVVSASAVAVGETTLKDQTIAFLQQLTQAVAQTPRTVLLLTIPGSQTELYGQAAKDLQQQLFSMAGQVSEIVGRIQTVRTPVQGDDIYEVLRRRLFDPLTGEVARQERDRRAHQVAQAYVAIYRALPNDVPQEVQEHAYIERIVRAYPFHPEVVRILYERWGTLPDFQRTRGALRILGLVLADLYASGRMEPLILPAHLNLAPGDLRNELVRVLDNPTFNNVIDSDIAGASAKAVQIDGGMGREHARFKPAERTATTIFLWSFSGAAGETRGATEAQIRVGVLSHAMQPAIIGNALIELRRKLWYLHEEGNTYRFDTRANLNRVIVQKEESVTAQVARKTVEEKLLELINAQGMRGRGIGPMFGGGSALQPRVYVFPKTSQDIADIPSLGVVLLRPTMHAPAGEALTELPSLVGEILQRYGERPREHRNVLAILVPDTSLVAETEKSARRLIALRAARNDSQVALPVAQRNELDAMLKTAEQIFPQEVARLYRSVVVSADASKGGMERLDLGQRTYSSGEALWDDAFQALSARDRLLDQLDPSLLASDHFGIWPRSQEALNTQKLWNAFVQFPHLPMVTGKHVLIDAITRGCDSGILGYALGDTPPFEGDNARFGKHGQNLAIEIAPTTWVISATYAREQIMPRNDPVRDIPPTLLTDPQIWPSGGIRRRLDDIWEAVVRYYSPQPLDGKHVLGAALHSGVNQGLFRIALDGGAPGDDSSLLDQARIDQLSGIELVRPAGGEPTKPRLLTIDVSNVELQQLSKITTGVIVPLQRQGARITLRLVIDADAPNGIDPEVIELTVKETLKQLGLTYVLT
ncbi:ATP-binding protein [Candidatus Chloroploca sp. Khr17]|uniref:ATP-binding protein n=1 Tax=Candidatus Chloroploca sp. Khr17 TaxID=2496869 RepID=UPI0013EA2E7A|nr:DUF499 domain-containing protein [Candidatus Chloroploca sp. Khr17]